MWWLWSLVVQVLHSPLFPSTPWLYLHRSVLLLPDKNDSDIQFDASTTLASLALPKTTASYEISENLITYKNLYVLDFVPNINVTFRVIARLLLGNEIPGTMRLFYFSSIRKHDLIQTIQRRIEQGDYITDSEQIGKLLDASLSEDFGQGAFAASQKPSLQQLTSKGASHLEPAKRVPSCYADPEKFGQRAETWKTNYHLYKHNCWHLCDFVKGI